MRAYSYGTHEAIPYLTLEVLEGVTLADELAKGPVPRTRLLLIARQLCDALIYLHAQSIVHRDLKPGNLMLLPPDDTPHLKLMDFGLVRQTDLSVRLTQEGVVFGSVAYMAPEQAQGLLVDFRADLYALGVILYEMATGQLPFNHDNPAMLLMHQLTTLPPPPRQLNSELDEDLEQLIMDLLAKEPAERPASTELVNSRLATLANERPLSLGPRTGRIDVIPRVPLIGRETALGEFAQRWAKVHRGQGQVVLLAGEAGLGKTRLLNEASLPVRLGGNRFLTSQCQAHASLPYQAIVDILETLLPNLSATEQAEMPAEMARLLSNTDTNVSSEPGAPNSAESLNRLFSGIWNTLRQTAQAQPLVIVIEDIHWADPSSLELLGYLAQRVPQAALLLVLTYRPEEIEADTLLATLQQDLQRNPVAHSISLAPLTAGQTADFLQAALPGKDILGQAHLPDWLVDSFQAATNGNPLFLEETLKALAAEGQFDEWMSQDMSLRTGPSRPSLQLPQNVLALAERRLGKLSAADRTILTAAAVLGSQFTFTLLEKLAGVDEDTLLDAIERLLATHLIEELPLQSGEDRYRFMQEALRQALLKSLSQRRLRLLHRRAFAAIEEDTGPVADLAYHAQAAHLPDPAFRYALAAGHEALRLYAAADAVTHYAQALSFLDQAETTSSQRCALCTSYGRAVELTGAFVAAIDHYQAMGELARQIGDPRLELAALVAEGTIQTTPHAFSDVALAETLSQTALSLARSLEDAASEAKIQWNLGNIYRWTNRIELALAAGEQSLSLAEAANLREQMAYTTNDLVFAYMEIGDIARMLSFGEQAMSLWREVGNRAMYVDSLATYSAVQAFIGNYAEALSLADEALDVSRSLNNRWGQAYSLYTYAYVYLQKMDIGSAIAPAQESVRLAREVDFISAQIYVNDIQAHLYLAVGATKQAETCADQALTLAQQHLPFLIPIAKGTLALVKMAAGDTEAAGQLLNNIPLKPDNPGLMQYFIPEKAMGYYALHQEDFSTALTLSQKMLTFAERQGITLFVPDIFNLQGRALVGLGRLAEARAVLQRALAMLRASDQRWCFLEIAGLLADLEEQAGNEDTAAMLRHEAHTVLDYIIEHIPEDEMRASFVDLPEVKPII
jgi:predicted ATPase